MASPASGEEPVRERPRLNLKKRDEAAAQRAALERASSGKSVRLQGAQTQSSSAVRFSDSALILLQNPFGAAKPREAVLANRVGKKEEEILKEEVLKEKLQVSPDCLASWIKVLLLESAAGL